MSSAKITQLYIYPIKSCAGISVNEIHCGEVGLDWDRQWVILNKEGKVQTQRDFPTMALIQPRVDADGTLHLAAPGLSPITIDSGNDRCSDTRVMTEVWGSEVAGFDQGDLAATWLSNYLNIKCRLVRFDSTFVRQSHKINADVKNARIAFTDGYPILVVCEESLADLNARLESPLPMNRFRPNVVIQGLGEYAEDKSPQLHAPELTLHAAKPCSRCTITTIDQATGTLHGPEPLKTLSQYKSDKNKVLFGHYFLPSKQGSLRLADSIDA